MSDYPTADQICAYLTATGWSIDETGEAAARWVKPGVSVILLHRPASHHLAKAVFDISMAENRHPADVRDDILDVDNPIHARVRAWAISSFCERAAGIVRRQIEEADAPGWPGAHTHRVDNAMTFQAVALAEALENTALAVRAAADADPPVPWHPLWTAAARAAEAITKPEPGAPDDTEEIKRRIAAYRIEAKEKEGGGKW